MFQKLLPASNSPRPTGGPRVSGFCADQEGPAPQPFRPDRQERLWIDRIREVKMLLENYTSLLQEGWHDVFAQDRTHHRAIEHALSLPMVLGRRTISRTICSLDRAHQDWSADYKLFSRSGWADRGVVCSGAAEITWTGTPRGPLVLRLTTRKWLKSGKKIAGDQLAAGSDVSTVSCKFSLRAAFHSRESLVSLVSQ